MCTCMYTDMCELILLLSLLVPFKNTLKARQKICVPVHVQIRLVIRLWYTKQLGDLL